MHKIKYNDISEVDRESIKNNVTYVNQEVYLFHDSLYNNLVFGCKNVDYEKLVREYIKRQVEVDAIISHLGILSS